MSNRNKCVTCSEDEIFLWLAGGLDALESQSLAEHLSVCASCETRILPEADLVSNLAQVAKRKNPPQAVKGRLMARVIGSQYQPKEERAWKNRFARERRRPFRRMAAAVVFAAGIGFLSTAFLTPPWAEHRGTNTVAIENATDELALRDLKIKNLETEIQLLASKRPKTEASLVNAAWPVMTRDGNAVGSIVCQKEGLNCFLEATGLQRLGPARVYSLWLENGAGRLIFLGAFDADTSGEAAFFTYADRELANAQNLVITNEPWDVGRNRPQGPVVFHSDPRS